MITIDNEVRQRIRIPLEIDGMADRYKTSNGYYTFTAPSLWTIEKNLFYLLKNSEQKNFDSQYKYRPSYLSFDEYGTVSLEYILMYVNNVFCVEEFDLNTVIIPSLSSIIDICQDKFSKKDISNMTEITW